MAASGGGRFKEFLKKYGKIGLGVHFSVSAASITGIFIAIKNNIDVESLLEKWHLPGLSRPSQEQGTKPSISSSQDGLIVTDESEKSRLMMEEQRKKRAEVAASTGAALTLAVLCNKALFPVRVPITIALTPPVARFLARRRMMKHGV